jgi:hypothetical protein
MVFGQCIFTLNLIIPLGTPSTSLAIADKQTAALKDRCAERPFASLLKDRSFHSLQIGSNIH